MNVNSGCNHDHIERDLLANLASDFKRRIEHGFLIDSKRMDNNVYSFAVLDSSGGLVSLHQCTGASFAARTLEFLRVQYGAASSVGKFEHPGVIHAYI